MAEVIEQVTGWQKATLVGGKVVLTLLLSWQLAELTWMVVAPEPLILKAPSKQASSQVSDGALGTAQYHLFGEAGEQPVEVVTKEVDAPDTRLKLELLGATKASRDEASSAIIAPKGGEGEFYRVGDVVQGRTRLAGVYDDKVILDTNGKLETLKFDEESKAGMSTQVVARPDARPAAPFGSLKERFGKVRSPGEFMDLVSEAASTDASGALKQMGLAPVGAGQGYKVQPGSMLSALQLQPGDIVLSVNGQMLGDPQSDQMILEQLGNEVSARIEVQRGNSRFVVNHTLR